MAVVVVIDVSVIAGTVRIVIGPLGFIEGEDVIDIGVTVIVVIEIDAVGAAVTVVIWGQAARVQRIGATGGLVNIELAVVVVVRIGIVAYTVSIVVDPFGIVEGEDIHIVGITVVVVIEIDAVGAAVTVVVR